MTHESLPEVKVQRAQFGLILELRETLLHHFLSPRIAYRRLAPFLKRHSSLRSSSMGIRAPRGSGCGAGRKPRGGHAQFARGFGAPVGGTRPGRAGAALRPGGPCDLAQFWLGDRAATRVSGLRGERSPTRRQEERNKSSASPERSEGTERMQAPENFPDLIRAVSDAEWEL